MYKKLFTGHGLTMVHFAEGGDGGGGGEGWQSEHSYFADNPEAAEASSKYKNIDAYFKGAHEAMTKVGRPFWLPDDHSNLTDEQKADIHANVAKMDNIPDTADGYVIDIPADNKVLVDHEAIASFKMLCKEAGISPATAQKIVSWDLEHQGKVLEDHAKDRTEQAKENFKNLSKQLNGDKQALAAMQQIKQYVQSKCVDADGKPDSKKWEEVQLRMFYEGKAVDEVLIQALLDPARLASEGGAPGGSQAGRVAAGALDYPEMD